LDDLEHFIAKSKNTFGIAFHNATCIAQNEAFPLAPEKLDVQKALQLSDLGAEGGRGEVERLGCGLDSALGRDGEEVPEVMVVELRVHEEKPNDIYIYSGFKYI
jgi:hypothetical protein